MTENEGGYMVPAFMFDYIEATVNGWKIETIKHKNPGIKAFWFRLTGKYGGYTYEHIIHKPEDGLPNPEFKAIFSMKK